MLTSNHSLCIQAPGQPVCISVCVCVCVCVCCVYSLSFLASPNNSHTVINIVWRSLWPAVSGPAAQGSGSDADEWPHTHTHTHTLSFISQGMHMCMHALQPVTINCQKGQEMCGIVITQDSLCFLLLHTGVSQCICVYVNMCMCICVYCSHDSLGAFWTICC